MYNEILSTRGEALSGAEYEAYLERAHVAGWCIELVQAAFLVADDMSVGNPSFPLRFGWFSTS